MGLSGPIASWARPGHSVVGVVASLALSLFAWPLLTAGAQGPGLEVRLPEAKTSPVQAAQLTRQSSACFTIGSEPVYFHAVLSPGSCQLAS